MDFVFPFFQFLGLKNAVVPPWGRGNRGYVGGGGRGKRGKCAQRGESPFLPILDAIFHYLWLYGTIIQILVTESVLNQLVTQLVTQSSENGFKRREFYDFNNF